MQKCVKMDFFIFSDKQYGVKEEIDRLNIFIENLDKIAKHNKLADNGLKPFRVGVNEYSDMVRQKKC